VLEKELYETQFKQAIDDFKEFHHAEDFEGGYYAVATARDPDDGTTKSLDETIQEVKDWVIQSDVFELDFTKTRFIMSQRPRGDDEELHKAMGYVQVELFIPVKLKSLML